MSEINLTFAASQAAAKEMGLSIKQPRANELFLDIDTEADYAFFTTQVLRLPEGLVDSWAAKPSKSGLPRRHIRVQLTRKVKSLTERVLLQAVLGSDRVRELLSPSFASRTATAIARCSLNESPRSLLLRRWSFGWPISCRL